MRSVPGTFDEVREVVAGLRTGRQTGVVTGGGTLLHVADPAAVCDVELVTTELNAVTSYDPADLIVTCQAGITLDVLRSTLAERDQMLPIWHPAPEAATVGGLVSFGWSGLGRQLYGPLRDRVLEVRAVTGEAKLIRGGARVVKNVTGFDLPRLFCGSHGTLGALVELSLKVHPRPPALCATRITGEDPVDMAGRLRSALSRAGQPLEAVLVREDGAWTGTLFAPGPDADARQLLAALPEGEAVQDADDTFHRAATARLLTGKGPDGAVVYRAAVAGSRLPELLARIGTPLEAVVDVAAGVGWIAAGAPEQDAIGSLRAYVEEQGGSLVLLSAPDALRRTIGTWGTPPAGIELMRRLKHQFDPDGILAPGRYLV